MAAVKTLYTLLIILFLTGMVLGVGILTLGKFVETTKVATEIINEQVTFASNVSTQLSQDEIISIGNYDLYNFTDGSVIYNSTDKGHNFTLVAGNWTEYGVLSLALINNGDYNVTYTYMEFSNSSRAAAYVEDSMMTIPSDWLPLIITISVLAIVLSLVIGSFGRRR